eukprot:CAMPEP_0198283238 /NCGR_PEP_ID=MMETSP1449-20131203/2894_1 /TAXON_ID=420275 /ORGANISM="Attheya septentrionalis, Strain CCMP2084" /LENGTH=290 /DNA_ID=CAMNT_0043979801 /DNA_START=64 /DNA_END=936 /DNA_ORIENTATION=+
MGRRVNWFAQELASPYFGLREPTGKVIDVQATFGSEPICRMLAARFLFLATSVFTLVRIVDSLSFFAFLTNWVVVFAVLYQLMALLCTMLKNTSVLEQPENGEGPPIPGFLVRLTWFLFSLVAPTSLLTTVIYWTMLFEPGNLDLTLEGSIEWVMTRGGIALLVFFDGFILTRIPIKLKHFYFGFGFAVIFIGWSIAHDILELGYDQAEDKDSLLYKILSWQTDWQFALVYSVLHLFIFTPVSFILVWTFSLSHRRYISNDYDGIDNNMTADQTEYTEYTDTERDEPHLV